MDSNNLSLRKLATMLGVSQPFLSQIRAGKRPMPEALKTKVQALGAYHLLIGDKQIDPPSSDGIASQIEKAALSDGQFVAISTLAGVGGSRTPRLGTLVNGFQDRNPGICDECFLKQKPSEWYCCPHRKRLGELSGGCWETFRGVQSDDDHGYLVANRRDF